MKMRIFEVIMGMRISIVSAEHIFIFEVIMEMRISTVPGDKLTFAVKQSILEMKKIMEKKIRPVHQRMEMKMKINPVQVFGFGFYFYTVMIETKLYFNSIQSCPHFETKLYLHLIQLCPNFF